MAGMGTIFVDQKVFVIGGQTSSATMGEIYYSSTFRSVIERTINDTIYKFNSINSDPGETVPIAIEESSTFIKSWTLIDTASISNHYSFVAYDENQNCLNAYDETPACILLQFNYQ